MYDNIFEPYVNDKIQLLHLSRECIFKNSSESKRNTTFMFVFFFNVNMICISI